MDNAVSNYTMSPELQQQLQAFLEQAKAPRLKEDRPQGISASDSFRTSSRIS